MQKFFAQRIFVIVLEFYLILAIQRQFTFLVRMSDARFSPDLLSATQDNAYYALTMFPYPSGIGLHCGHASIFTINDVVARFQRMQGKVVYNPFGFDAFGLPTENYAMERGIPAYEVTQINKAFFIEQIKALELSFDYTRVIDTSDPVYYKWTQWIFAELYRAWLVYRDTLRVNRCPSCQTVLANDQVVEGKCERCKTPIIQKKHPQRFIKITAYADKLLADLDLVDRPEETKTAQRNWIGRSEGAEIDFQIVQKDQKVQNVQSIQKDQKWKNNWEEYDEKTKRILWIAIEVHKKYKDTITEKQFRDILVEKLKKVWFEVEKEKSVSIREEWVFIGNRYIDIVIDNDILLELKKSIFQKETQKWIRQLRNYLDLQWKWCGLFLNIGADTLQIKRLNFYDKNDSFELSENSESFEKITVFTTRPDTLYGVTALVLAPEITSLDAYVPADHLAQLQTYRKTTLAKTAVQRQQGLEDKTGVFSGIYVLHPLTGERVPVWFADYVLPDYATGAVMFVPAHDERDWTFAQKFSLPTKHVIAQHYISWNAPVSGKENTIRHNVLCILFNQAKTHVACLQRTSQNRRSFVMWGVDGEDLIVAGQREIMEETGYTDIAFLEQIPWEVHAEYYAAHKDVNRYSIEYGLVYQLASDANTWKQDGVENHHIVRIPVEEVSRFLADIPGEVSSNIVFWNRFLATNRAYTWVWKLINSWPFDGLDNQEAKKKIIAHLESQGVGRAKVSYKLRDWSVSRQRYWGSPIPVYYDEQGTSHLIPDSELPVLLPLDLENYKPSGKSPLEEHPTFPEYKKDWKVYRRECDTLDTFMCSSFYFLRFLDPTNPDALVRKELADAWLPIELYTGGKEHTVGHLLYARFIHKFLYDQGYLSCPEPFQKLVHQGMVLWSDGRKMGKRYNNGIDPIEMVQLHGADALRTYLMFMGPVEADKARNDNALLGVKKFLERVERIMQQAWFGKTSQATTSALHLAIQGITADIEELKFNTAVSKLMILTNTLYEQQAGTTEDMKAIACLLAPFAPLLAERLWKALWETSDVHYASWPVADPAKIIIDTINFPVQINGKMRGTLVVKPGLTEEEVLAHIKQHEHMSTYVLDKEIKKTIFVPDKIINIIVA
jgi:leucyl-tRNA synthetase